MWIQLLHLIISNFKVDIPFLIFLVILSINIQGRQGRKWKDNCIKLNPYSYLQFMIFLTFDFQQHQLKQYQGIKMHTDVTKVLPRSNRSNIQNIQRRINIIHKTMHVWTKKNENFPASSLVTHKKFSERCEHTPYTGLFNHQKFNMEQKGKCGAKVYSAVLVKLYQSKINMNISLDTCYPTPQRGRSGLKQAILHSNFFLSF